MALPNDHGPTQDEPEQDLARLLARGVCRALLDRGLATLTEFTLISGRRVDVIGLDLAGQVTIVEVKSSLADFRSVTAWFARCMDRPASQTGISVCALGSE